jgi:hypothetical protein
MLIIREAQYAALSKHRSTDFGQRMASHLRLYFPDDVAALDDTELRAAIDGAIQRARGHGLISARDLCRFLNLCAIFGWNFDDDNGLRQVLRDVAIKDPGVRLQRAYSRCLRRLEVAKLNTKPLSRGAAR